MTSSRLMAPVPSVPASVVVSVLASARLLAVVTRARSLVRGAARSRLASKVVKLRCSAVFRRSVSGRLPKIGFRSKMARDTAEVLSYQLDKLDAGDVDFAALRAAKLVPSRAKQAKIVLKGELSKKFVLKGVAATAGAKAAIEALGGSVEE